MRIVFSPCYKLLSSHSFIDIKVHITIPISKGRDSSNQHRRHKLGLQNFDFQYLCPKTKRERRAAGLQVLHRRTASSRATTVSSRATSPSPTNETVSSRATSPSSTNGEQQGYKSFIDERWKACNKIAKLWSSHSQFYQSTIF